MIMEREFTIEYRDWDSFMKDVQKPPTLKLKYVVKIMLLNVKTPVKDLAR
jgi:hypothetical protein